MEEVGGFAGSAGSAGSLQAQCGDGLDALLLLLHALYLAGIRSTYLEHHEEDTQRLSAWGSLAGPLLSVHGGSTVGGLPATAVASLAEREQRLGVLRSHRPGERGPTRRRPQADMASLLECAQSCKLEDQAAVPGQGLREI